MATEGTTLSTERSFRRVGIPTGGYADNPAELGDGVVGGSGGAAYIRAESLGVPELRFCGQLRCLQGALCSSGVHRALESA